MAGPRAPDGTAAAGGAVGVGWALGALGLLAACQFALILAAPPNLLGNNEERVAAYVVDVLDNGHVVLPRDAAGELMRKPPVLAWLTALATWLLGGLSPAALYLPSALATLGAGWLVFLAGRAFVSGRAGLLGGMVYLLSPAAGEQLATARYDGLFAFTVALAALAAFRAWAGRAGWTPFWLAAALTTLTKGPLGVILAAAGLLAVLWERRDGQRAPLPGHHAVGIACFAILTGGWLGLAWLAHGRELIDTMVVGELVAHAVRNPHGEPFGRGLWLPSLHVLLRFAPWSLLTAAGLWRVARSPAREATERRFERFVACWFGAGLILFSLASHHRQRLILPLIPPAAMLAGRELERWLARWPARRRAAAVAVVAIAWLAGVAIHFHVVRPRTSDVARTVAMRDAARALRTALGPGFPLTHVDSPFAFRFYLGQVGPGAALAEAADLLRGESPAFVASADAARLAAGTAAREVWRWPPAGAPRVQVVSNRERLERPDGTAYLAGAFRVEVAGADVTGTRSREVAVRPRTSAWSVTVRNRSGRAERITVRRIDTGERLTTTVGPGESRRLPPP